MSTVIKQIGLVDTISTFASPMLSFSPVIVMFCVAFVTGFMTQSYAASVAVLVPFLQVVLGTGADPFAAAFAAASGASLIQYFLTGGPVAALATVIPVVPDPTSNRLTCSSVRPFCSAAWCLDHHHPFDDSFN